MYLLEISLNFFYCATIIVAISSNQNSTDNAIEVYQIIPESKTIILEDDSEAELDSDLDLIKFPSGTTCKYSAGSCYDNQIHRWHHWDLHQSLPIHDTPCKDLIRVYNTSYDPDVLDLRTNPLVVFENGSFLFALRLIQKDNLCGRNLWRTNHSELIVAVGSNNFVSNKNEDGVKENPEIVTSLQNELNMLREENARLKGDLDSVQNQLQLNNLELNKLNEAINGMYNERKLSKRNVDEFPGVINSVCNNYVLFPCENVLSAVVVVSYITFSVINTMMNYSSLRTLRIKRDKTIIFYCLTQGLTTRYMCRTLGATKSKVDKWFLDIEHPLHDFK